MSSRGKAVALDDRITSGMWCNMVDVISLPPGKVLVGMKGSETQT